MSIKFHYKERGYRLHRTEEIKVLVRKIILTRNKIPGNISYIITNDEELLKINREFLGHNYFTDVISFDYSAAGTVSGEVYISRDTVRSNAVNYKVSFKSEILRVIIHGTLHLCGMTDGTEEQRKRMKREEDYWLALLR